MEKCPECRSDRKRYTFLIRGRVTCIAVQCDWCLYTGPEVPLRSGERDALEAARLWDAPPSRVNRPGHLRVTASLH